MNTRTPTSRSRGSPRITASVLFLLGVLVAVFLYLPLCMVVVHSFNSAPHGGPWRSFTLAWYQALVHNPVTLHAARTTLLLGGLSTAAATLLGTLLALGLTRHFTGRRLIEGGMLLPVVVPDILMAVGLLLLYRELRDRLGWFEPGLLTMMLAHITFQIPFVALVVKARLAGFDPTLEEAARDLGASGAQTFWHIKFPIIWPGILAGALLALTLSLDDFVVSFFTTGPGATTLPILIYSSVKRGITPEINAISALFIATAVVATLALTWLTTAPVAVDVRRLTSFRRERQPSGKNLERRTSAPGPHP